ncbi:hypothetical protein LOZ10_006004 [Ophidiomyces ophidiicola]|nr:hypothetical protein LOZ10_006004 [Ophidiomyces ophidiicola]
MATTRASSTRPDQVTWDRSMTPMLDFQLASANAHFGLQSLPLSRSHWDMPNAPRTLPTQPEPVPATVPKDIALTVRRERELLDAAGPVTYTPATHRVSKAKKGKRVHLCQFPGCNKIFTRAEHRRRHELNHNPQASFVCSVEGCGKGFHRNDLLARHMEKHNDPQPRQPRASPRRRKNSHTSTVSGRTASNPPPISDPRLTPVSLSVSSATSSIAPPASVAPTYGGNFTPSFWDQASRPLEKPQPVPQTPYTHIDELVPFPSPGSSRPSPPNSSPFQLPSQFPEAVFAQQLTSSPPLIASTFPEWTSLEAVVSQHPQMMLPTVPTTAAPFEANVPQTVGEPSLIYSTPHRKVVDGSPAVPVPLSSLDGVEWFALRRELAAAPGVISGNGGMAIIDLAKWQDCLECYWLYFHPLFPIVHRASFFATKPSPLMTGAMVAIGSQYDQRPNSKEYSLALLEACQKILSKRAPITSRSRTSDIQAVFLLEMLSKYRSRRADIKISHRLRSLYGSFIQDGHWASQNPLAAYHSLPPNPSIEDLRNANKFWAEHETRRRVLQAAFILEVQQSLFFQQPLATFLRSNSEPTIRDYRISEKVDLPFPCSADLWECSDITQWVKLANDYEAMLLSGARDRVIQSASFPTIDVDPFQASLIFCQTLPNTNDLEDAMEVFVKKITEKPASDGSGGVSHTGPSYIRFMYHVLLAAKHVPVQALLTVSGESWLFSRKVSEAEFRASTEKMQAWISNQAEAKRALWHAINALQYAIEADDPNLPIQARRQMSTDQQANTQIPTNYPNSRCPSDGTHDNPPAITDTSATSPRFFTSPLTMLQANWALYICTLICQTYENSIPSSSDPQSSISVHQYITTFLSSYSSLQNFLDCTTVPTHHDLRPVLEHIRAIIARNSSGSLSGAGLLNEAGRVLMRLIEGGRQQGQQQQPQPQQRQQQARDLQHFYQHRHQHTHTHQHQHQQAWEFY